MFSSNSSYCVTAEVHVGQRFCEKWECWWIRNFGSELSVPDPFFAGFGSQAINQVEADIVARFFVFGARVPQSDDESNSVGLRGIIRALVGKESV